MRKIQKILLGVFAGGVLLTGIGTGMALVEYSTLNYGGQKIIGEENLVTKTLEYELEEDQKEIILGRSYSQRADLVTEVVEDVKVPEYVVQYEVTYNGKRIRPFLISENSEEYMGIKDGPIRVRLGFNYFGDSFGEFMENKDIILNDLKNHTISSYDTNYVTKVQIKVHPNTMELLEESF